MVSMYYRCRRHIEASEKEDLNCDSNYNFWQHHYQLDKDLKSYGSNLLGHIKPQTRHDDPFAFVIHMNLCAIRIDLHEHAILKAQRQELPDALVTESENQCKNVVVEIVEYTQFIKHISLDKVCESHFMLESPEFSLNIFSQRTTFQQVNTFLMWPLAQASLVLGRHLINRSWNVNQLTVLLEQLQLTMQSLNETSGHWDGVKNMIFQHLEVIKTAAV